VAKQKDKAGDPVRDLVIRIAIFGVLGVVLVLALLDFRAKNQATKTATAWNALLDEANENSAGVLHVDKLPAAIVGSPEKTTKTDVLGLTQLVYTWNGTLRYYKVFVIASSEDDTGTIEEIKGPTTSDSAE